MSYSQQEILARRLFARGLGRATPLAESFAMGRDPELAIAIAPIRIVTEEQVQAIAFGHIGAPPQILTRMDPLSRDVSDLIPFAQFMAQTGAAIAAGARARLWLPHQNAIDTLDLLGRRYITNQQAPQIVRELGRVCRAYGAQMNYAGQPLVACALEQLIDHFVTGQSPAEDRHLGSMLTWIYPPQDGDVYAAASAAALLPASGILPNAPGYMHDARVEALRRLAKNTRNETERRAAHAEMDRLLAMAAQREWDLLQRARAALLALPQTGPADAECMAEAHSRMSYHLGANGAFNVVRPHAVSMEMKRREAHETAAQRRAWRDDTLRRAAAARRGRVLQGEILSIGAYRRGGPRPIIEIATTQDTLRLRENDKLTPLDRDFDLGAELAAIGVGRQPEERIVRVRVTNGFKYLNSFSVGDMVAWETAKVDLLRRETEMSTFIAQRAPWPLHGEPPADAPSALPAGDHVATANALLLP
jgi:hypothetical protein